jgi:3-oxoacyl-[acyl-carrier protein] reductase
MTDYVGRVLRRFDGLVAVISGASAIPSIGHSCAVRLGLEGARVVVNGRDPGALEVAVKELTQQGILAIGVAGSMHDADTATRIVDAAVSKWDRVDLVVNTVGGAPHHTTVADLTRDELLGTVDLNLWPTLQLVQAALPRLTSGAAIVNISSGSPHKTTAVMASYAAAKAALNALTRTMAADLRTRGIRVNAVSPGLTKTHGTRSMWEGDDGAWAAAHSPLGRMTEADDIAAAAAFLLSSDAAAITGVCLDVDGGDHLMSGGWSPFAPQQD